jgi:hypothetical protein
MPVHIRSTADGDLRLTLSNNGEVLHAQSLPQPHGR